MQHGENVVQDQPLVQMLEELADANQAVDTDRQQTRVDAKLLDPRQQGCLGSLEFQKTCPKVDAWILSWSGAFQMIIPTLGKYKIFVFFTPPLMISLS